MSNFQYVTYPCSFVGGATIDMTQIMSAAINPGSNVDEIMPAGQLIRLCNILAFADPRIPVVTTDLDKVFATVSPTTGYPCASGGTFRAQQRADNSTFTGGSSNFKVASGAGFLIPESLTVSQDRPAVLELSYVPFSSDGLTAPLTATGSNSFSGVATPAFSSCFYLGPCYINSALIEALTSIRINFGIKWRSLRLSGEVFAQKGHILAQLPSIELGFARPDLLPSTITSLHLNAAAGAFAVYLQRGSPDGTRYATSATNHFKLSAATSSL